MKNVSQTQLSNFALLAGLIVIVANQFGIVFDKEQVIFVLAAVWSLGWTAYSYYQRFKKGDIKLSGVRK